MGWLNSHKKWMTRGLYLGTSIPRVVGFLFQVQYMAGKGSVNVGIYYT